MEQRKAKLIIGKSGGTAAGKANNYKVSLPTKWVEDMGINSSDRELDIIYDGNEIRIRKRASDNFSTVLSYYDENTLCSSIYADFEKKTIKVTNHINNLIKTAFGANCDPTWEDFEYFLKERCISRERDGLGFYLEALGLTEYNPMDIILRTNGRMAEDNQWILVENYNEH